MQANTIPGTTNIVYNAQRVGIMIVDLQKFYAYANDTIDLAEQRRLWIERRKQR